MGIVPEWDSKGWCKMTRFTLRVFLVLIAFNIIAYAIVFSNREETPVPQVETPAVEVRDQTADVQALAVSNGFKPSERVVNAILQASETYQIDALELTAIAIVETGLGKYTKTRLNQNGTHDRGLFQINTVNWPKCIEYNLDSPEGSALCAAKLLSEIKAKRADYLGVYHSKTPDKKARYMKKITKVLASVSDK